MQIYVSQYNIYVSLLIHRGKITHIFIGNAYFVQESSYITFHSADHDSNQGSDRVIKLTGMEPNPKPGSFFFGGKGHIKPINHSEIRLKKNLQTPSPCSTYFSFSVLVHFILILLLISSCHRCFWLYMHFDNV